MFSQAAVFETLGRGLVSTIPDHWAFLAALAEHTLLPAELRARMPSGQLTAEKKLRPAGPLRDHRLR